MNDVEQLMDQIDSLHMSLSIVKDDYAESEAEMVAVCEALGLDCDASLDKILRAIDELR